MRSLFSLILVLSVSGCDLLLPPPAVLGGSDRRGSRGGCVDDGDCDGGEVCDNDECVSIREGEGDGPVEGEGDVVAEGEGDVVAEGEGDGVAEGEGDVVGDPDDVVIEVTWSNADGDVDLHLSRAGPPVWCQAASDCYYAATTTTWGATLELDDLDGFGPERTRLHAPADGIYTVGVVVYTLDSSPVNATVTVTQRGRVLHTSTQALTTVPWLPVALIVEGGVVSVEVLDLVEAQNSSCFGASDPAVPPSP